MIVARCIINRVLDLPGDRVINRISKTISVRERIALLEIGKSYAVFAIDVWDDGGVRIYIDCGSDFPHPFPIEFFELTSNDIPIGWAVKFAETEYGRSVQTISFREWLADPNFFEKLIDDDPVAQELYRYWRRRFGNPDI